MTDKDQIQQVFGTIFEENRWKSKESVSGTGSSLGVTRIIRAALPPLFEKLGIKSLVDAPCGDYNWMRELAYDFSDYTGADIVAPLVERLQSELGNDKRRFIVADIVNDVLPAADALFCRDCLVHLPFAAGLKAVQNWKKAPFKYVILTTFPGRTNRDCVVGRWRALDMQAAPYLFPEPIEIIRERLPNPDDRNNEKSLGVWRLQDLA